MRIASGSITLNFSQGREISLESVAFLYDPALGEIRSVRGRALDPVAGTCSFHWSPAVKALAVLLLKSAEHIALSLGPSSLPELSGEAGSLASSLDYALSKSPFWLADMFGHDRDGTPYARSLITRSNPERKRPGPVVLSLNSGVLNPNKISVYLDGLPVVSAAEINQLWTSIEISRMVAKVRELPEMAVTAPQLPGTRTSAVAENYHLPQASESQSYVFHHLTSLSDIERDFLQSIHRRILGRKFSFLGPQAALKWQAICDSQYTHFSDSLEMVKESAHEIARHCRDSTSIIAIWPGNGVKEAFIAHEINLLRDTPVFLVDTSQDMLRASLAAMSSLECRKEVFVADFTVPGVLTDIRRHVANSVEGPATFLLLGGTISSYPQGEIFSCLRDAMTKDDKLVLDCSYTADSQTTDMESRLEAWIQTYDTPEFRDQLLNSVGIIGLGREDGSIEVEYTRDRFLPSIHRLELFFRLGENCRRRFLGKELFFCKNERILLSFFYQYPVPILRMLFEAQGFSIDYERLSPSFIRQLICTKAS